MDITGLKKSRWYGLVCRGGLYQPELCQQCKHRLCRMCHIQVYPPQNVCNAEVLWGHPVCWRAFAAHSEGQLQSLINRFYKVCVLFSLTIALRRPKSCVKELQSHTQTRRHLTANTKVAVYRACVISTLLYGSKSWTEYATQERKAECLPPPMSAWSSGSILARQGHQ